MFEQLNFEILRSVQVSIQRSRTLTTILAVSCMLALVAFWNGREKSWMNLRIQRADHLMEVDSLVRKEMTRDQLAAYRTFRLKTITNAGWDTIATPVLLAQLEGSGKIPSAKVDAILEPHIDPVFIDFLVLERDLRLSKALIYKNALLSDEKMTPALLKNVSTTRDKLIKAYIDGTLLVNLPIIGLVFDVNDLGLFAGISFTLLLLAYVFILIRESSSVQMLRDVVLNGIPMLPFPDMVRAYQLASMTNVLTIIRPMFVAPPDRTPFVQHAIMVKQLFLQVLSKSIYIAPGVLTMLIYLNDKETLNRALTLNPGSGALLTATFTFQVVVWILCFIAIAANTFIEYQWSGLAYEIEKKRG